MQVISEREATLSRGASDPDWLIGLPGQGVFPPWAHHPSFRIRLRPAEEPIILHRGYSGGNATTSSELTISPTSAATGQDDKAAIPGARSKTGLRATPETAT